MVAVAVDVPVVGNGTAKLEIKTKITGATDNGSYKLCCSIHYLYLFIFYIYPGTCYMLHIHATYMLHILHATCTYMYRVLVLSTLLDGTLKLIRNVTSNFYINLSTCNSNFSLIFSL